MQNLDEKLILMQWLSEKNIQGKQWINLCSDGDYEIYSYKIYEEMDRWFPLEQVLQLLPRELPRLPENNFCHYLEMNLTAMCPNMKYTHGRMLSDVYDFCEYLNDDIHLSALKLLKQVIEQYPEAVKK